MQWQEPEGLSPCSPRLARVPCDAVGSQRPEDVCLFVFVFKSHFFLTVAEKPFTTMTRAFDPSQLSPPEAALTDQGCLQRFCSRPIKNTGGFQQTGRALILWQGTGKAPLKSHSTGTRGQGLSPHPWDWCWASISPPQKQWGPKFVMTNTLVCFWFGLACIFSKCKQSALACQ